MPYIPIAKARGFTETSGSNLVVEGGGFGVVRILKGYQKYLSRFSNDGEAEGYIPAVSVIIPAYNAALSIRKTLDSVFKQSFRDFELIVVDDGSTDQTAQIVTEVASTAVLVRQTNSGCSAARNVGLDRARGRFVTFLDSDDYLHEDYLANLYAAAQDSRCEVVISGQYKVNADGDRVAAVRYAEDRQGQGISKLRRLNISGKFYSRDLIERFHLRFQEGCLYEDNAFNLAAIFLANKVVTLEYAGYFQLLHENSITTGSRFKLDNLPLKGLEEAVKLVKQNGCSDPQLFEFTFLSFMTYFLALANKRNIWFRGKQQNRKGSWEIEWASYDFLLRITGQYFPGYAHNSYLGFFKCNKDVSLAQQVGVTTLCWLMRLKLLLPALAVWHLVW